MLPLIFYKKFISPLLPRGCIYTPSCSSYMKDAILQSGVLKGVLFGLLRVLRCNPFFKGGEDKFYPNITLKLAIKKFGEFWVFKK
ncbi:MAG: membrane protein insertion efficiency factor YidD [Brevinematia bacterium]